MVETRGGVSGEDKGGRWREGRRGTGVGKRNEFSALGYITQLLQAHNNYS